SLANDARLALAPVRPPAPQHGPVVLAVGVVRRVFEADGPDRVVTRRRSAWRRRPLPCGAGGRRRGPGGRRGPRGGGPCRAPSPGGRASAWPGRSRGGTGRRPR